MSVEMDRDLSRMNERPAVGGGRAEVETRNDAVNEDCLGDENRTSETSQPEIAGRRLGRSLSRLALHFLRDAFPQMEMPKELLGRMKERPTSSVFIRSPDDHYFKELCCLGVTVPLHLDQGLQMAAS
eukprot:170432-Amphidinium_carterae.2